MSTKSLRADLHQTITDKIVAMLDEASTTGASFPWCRPGVTLSRPTNALTGKRYNGINILSLWCDGHTRDYRSGIWATYKQWQQLGAQVRQGETSSPIVFYKSLEIEDRDAETKPGDDATTRVIRMAKGYAAFNADQVDGHTLPAMPPVDLTERLAHVEQFVAHCAVPVTYGGASAYYRPSENRIQMPERVLFETSPTSTATEGLYGVLLHELRHAAGAKHRLDRQLSTKFGDNQYAAEELIAELCSAMLCGDLDITPQLHADYARYIDSWLLRADKTAIFAAAAKARQAAQYRHDRQQPTVEAAHAA